MQVSWEGAVCLEVSAGRGPSTLGAGLGPARRESEWKAPWPHPGLEGGLKAVRSADYPR